MEDIYDKFREINQRGNGLMSLQEFIVYYTKENQLFESNEWILKIFFHLVDTDGSNRIECDEYAQFAEIYYSRKRSTKEELLEILFILADKSKDEKLQKDEILDLVKGMSNDNFDQIVEETFDKFDVNGDGEIDIDEFKVWLLPFFYEN